MDNKINSMSHNFLCRKPVIMCEIKAAASFL